MSRSNDMDDLDTWHEDEVICPYCKATQSDSAEYMMGMGVGLEHDTFGRCDSCGKEFEVSIELEPTYSTYKMEESTDE